MIFILNCGHKEGDGFTSHLALQTDPFILTGIPYCKFTPIAMLKNEPTSSFYIKIFSW